MACMDATLSMSWLEMGTIPNSGYEFAGDYNPKGCFAYLSGDYKGLSFYGTGKVTYPEYYQHSTSFNTLIGFGLIGPALRAVHT